jgi:invasion protein IalB
MRLIPASAVAVLLCASAAAYAADETAPSPAPSEAQQEKPKKVCRTETATGSVMPKRVCRTPEQVEAEQEAAQRTLDHNRDGH